MCKQVISILLIAFLANLTFVRTACAATETEKTVRFAEKVKSNIVKLGTGKTALIKVKLKDKSKFEGYVSAVDEKTFTIADSKTNTVTTIEYSRVKSAKGKNLSTGAKIGIGVGIAAAVIIFLIYFVVVIEHDE